MTIPVAALREAGLEPGDRVVARAEGSGRVILEREHDVLGDFAGCTHRRLRTRRTAATPQRMALTVVDAGVLIGFLDRNDLHHQAAADALAAMVDRGDRIVIPSSALAELLVGPARQGHAAVAAVPQLIERVPLEVAPLDQDVAVAAASLLAKHRAIRLPDALVLATAAAMRADVLLTTDRGWPTARRLAINCSIHVI